MPETLRQPAPQRDQDDGRPLSELFAHAEDDTDDEDGAEDVLAPELVQQVEVTLGAGSKTTLLCGRAYTLNELVRLAK